MMIPEELAEAKDRLIDELITALAMIEEDTKEMCDKDFADTPQLREFYALIAATVGESNERVERFRHEELISETVRRGFMTRRRT